jgi:hypothetical protein
MTMKYWRLKLKGERSADEIQSAIGRSGGNVVRIQFEGGETHVYFAAEKSAALKGAKAMKQATTPQEVKAGEVTKFS